MLNDHDALLRQLHELRSEHRDLDTVIVKDQLDAAKDAMAGKDAMAAKDPTTANNPTAPRPAAAKIAVDTLAPGGEVKLADIVTNPATKSVGASGIGSGFHRIRLGSGGASLPPISPLSIRR